jgi:hypothetical protein
MTLGKAEQGASWSYSGGCWPEVLIPSGKTVKSTGLCLRGVGVGVPLRPEEGVSVRAGAIMSS